MDTEHLDQAINTGSELCNALLEPLHATFGQVSIRSAFRSKSINDLGNRKKRNCSRNEANFAHHIWDEADDDGVGATACIVLPWFMDKYRDGADWRALAYWIHDHLPYSGLEFFDGEGMCSFNISWHEKPKKTVTGYMPTKTVLLKDAYDKRGFAEWYEGFPPLARSGEPMYRRTWRE